MHKHIEYREPYEDDVDDGFEPCPERFEITATGKALTKGWVGDPEKRAKLLDRLYDIALKTDKDRNSVMATKAILSAERVQASWEELELKRQALEMNAGNQTNVNILAIAAELGGDDDGLASADGGDDAQQLSPPMPN
jgi:hypothetical protein